MSKKAEEIAKALKDLIGDQSQNLIPVTVKSVETDNYTCTVEFEGIELSDVRLTAVVDSDSKSVIAPAVNSDVLIAFVGSSETDAVIVAYSKIEEITINANQITINNGDNGGLIKIEELKTQISKNNQILQSIMSIISGAPIPESGNGAPSAFQSVLSAVIAGKSVANLSNIENTKIKH